MQKYEVWNRTSPINGQPANYILSQMPFNTYNGEIILLYASDNTTVTNIECKDILASIYNIDKNLSTDLFMAQYFAVLKAIEEQAKNIII